MYLNTLRIIPSMLQYYINLKKYKKCVEFYKMHINTQSFEKFCQNRDKEYDTDRSNIFFDNLRVYRVNFGDVLTNDGITNLLKCLYSLPKKKFKVINFYKKPTCFRKYDYVKLQYTSNSAGILAEIELIEDKFIDKIQILWSQINNYYAYIEYKFSFKKLFDEKLFHEFVMENLECFTKYDYFFYYDIKENQDVNYQWMLKFEFNLFPIILQHYITTYFYSETGRDYELICLTAMVSSEKLDLKNFDIGFMAEGFYNKKGNYLIRRDFTQENAYFLISGKNHMPSFQIIEYIRSFGNEFFYKYFGYRELKIFEEQFSKYASGRRKITFNKKIKSLLNRLQALTDGKTIPFNNLEKQFEENWDYYWSNNKTNYNELHGENLTRIKEVYSKNFDYFKILTELNYTKWNKIASIFTIVISILATIIALVGIFID